MTREQRSAATRLEARCLTCGRSYTAFDGEDGAEAHKASTGHIIEGYRALRARYRRSQVPADPFAAHDAAPVVEPKMPTRPEELDPDAMTPRDQ